MKSELRADGRGGSRCFVETHLHKSSNPRHEGGRRLLVRHTSRSAVGEEFGAEKVLREKRQLELGERKDKQGGRKKVKNMRRFGRGWYQRDRGGYRGRSDRDYDRSRDYEHGREHHHGRDYERGRDYDRDRNYSRYHHRDRDHDRYEPPQASYSR